MLLPGDREQIAASIEKQGECWIWKGPVHPNNGHPTPVLRSMSVRRLLFIGKHKLPFSFRQRVKNTCLNELCVNPKHSTTAKPVKKEFSSAA